jgi:antitoxin PrlF
VARLSKAIPGNGGNPGKFKIAGEANGCPGAVDGSATVWYYIYTNVMGGAMESAITVKGQATIPKAIREHLGLKPGDRVKFFVHPDGSVVLLPKLPVTALRGMLKTRRARPVTTDEMTEAVAKSAGRERPADRR